MVLKKVLAAVLPGCAPDIVTNGLQVLDAVAARPYDLVFMDVHMPEMDGVTASERIRDGVPSSHGALRPRIVAVTADTLAPLRQRCAEAGIEGFVSKPFRVEDLRRVLERMGLQPAAPGAAGAPGHHQQQPLPPQGRSGGGMPPQPPAAPAGPAAMAAAVG
jgi:CheY-like chemotaxis protein